MPAENFGNGFTSDHSNPCYGCVAPKRHPGCHSKCKERAEWVAVWEARQKHLKEYLKANVTAIEGAERVNKSIKANGLVYGSKFNGRKVVK